MVRALICVATRRTRRLRAGTRRLANPIRRRCSIRASRVRTRWCCRACAPRAPASPSTRGSNTFSLHADLAPPNAPTSSSTARALRIWMCAGGRASPTPWRRRPCPTRRHIPPPSAAWSSAPSTPSSTFGSLTGRHTMRPTFSASHAQKSTSPRPLSRHRVRTSSARAAFAQRPRRLVSRIRSLRSPTHRASMCSLWNSPALARQRARSTSRQWSFSHQSPPRRAPRRASRRSDKRTMAARGSGTRSSTSPPALGRGAHSQIADCPRDLATPTREHRRPRRPTRMRRAARRARPASRRGARGSPHGRSSPPTARGASASGRVTPSVTRWHRANLAVAPSDGIRAAAPPQRPPRARAVPCAHGAASTARRVRRPSGCSLPLARGWAIAVTMPS